MARVVTEEDNWPIQPKDIAIPEKLGSPFPEAFGCWEMEIDASRIVSFYQERGGWVAFTTEEIRTHSLAKERTTRHGVFDFGYHAPLVGGAVSLIVGGFVVRDVVSGKCRVTDVFIERCYKASRGEKIEAPAPQPEPPPIPVPRSVVPGVWRHFGGGLYVVLGVARHMETGEQLVIYRFMSDTNLRAQPEDEFLGEYHLRGTDKHGPIFDFVKSDV